MNRLPVLMYHNFVLDNSKSNGLALSDHKFEQQLIYLKEKKYQSFFVSELDNLKLSSTKNIVLTFDDVTLNQLELAAPLLKKYNFKATFYVPFSFVGKTDLWNGGSEKIMTIAELKSLDSDIIELGFHSFEHKKYSEMTSQQIEIDFKNCHNFINNAGLNIKNSLAYPYGNFPKKGLENKNFIKILNQNKIKFGLRIGNRINNFPFDNPFEINRIDVKGEWSLLKFKFKIRFGKLF